MTSRLSENLRAGRRALEGVRGFSMLQDFAWNRRTGKWALHCAIEAQVAADGPIPRRTVWYILVDDSYPSGTVVFYPAKEGGITQTFHHQNYNGLGSTEVPWRSGRLCVDTGMRTLQRRAYDVEPYDPDEKLLWHVLSVQEWLALASRGQLAERGDPYELPYVPSAIDCLVAFNEGPESFAEWRGFNRQFGHVTLNELEAGFPVFIPTKFFSRKGDEEFSPAWGRSLGEPLTSLNAWVMLNEVPVLDPWQIPMTWGELRLACRKQGIELDSFLEPLVQDLRRENGWHLLLVGFPIPARVQCPEVQVHWLALQLPAPSTWNPPGFRRTEGGYWRFYRTQRIGDRTKLNWIATENWHQREVSNRGRVDDDFASKSVLMIGAGAVGSALGELLVRAGVRRLTVMDADRFGAGNLVRHTLLLEDIGEAKATQLAERLNGASIHATINAIDAPFPPVEQDHRDRANTCDVVIDCSGSDKVAEDMGRFEWDGPVTFVSLSLGLHARRMFIYAAHGEKFPSDDFRDQLDPWLRSEIEGYDSELPREGLGCWHPKMPARVDDVWMMTASAFKVLETSVTHAPLVPTLTVLEQQVEGGQFAGLRRIDSSVQRS